MADCWAESMLVSTVTANKSGGWGRPSRAARAAASMAGPPEAWTVSMCTPNDAADRTAPATVLGMSWNFRSRKTEWPRLRIGSRTAGPAATKSSSPTLNHWQVSSSRETSAAADAASGTSRATIKRLRASVMGLTSDEASDVGAGFRSSGAGIAKSYGKTGNGMQCFVARGGVMLHPGDRLLLPGWSL